MQNTPYKLIFLDIDGTFVPPASLTPPESAVQAVRTARQNGHRVFLCTGRNMAMLRPLLRYGFDGVVASAGGFVSCSGRTLFDCPMRPEQTRAALDVLHGNGVLCSLEARDATFGDDGAPELPGDLGLNRSQRARVTEWRRAIARTLGIRPMAEYDGSPVYKIVIQCLQETQLEEPRRVLDGQFRFCMENWRTMGCLNGELINTKFNKGRGLLQICKALDVSPADTIAFGDGPNDWEVMGVAGISVCMGNGSAQLKQRASRVCPPVDQDGLAKGFAELGLI